MKRLLSIILISSMIFGISPSMAIAAENPAPSGATELSNYIKNSVYDVSKTKYGALPGNIAYNSTAVCYKNKLYFILRGEFIVSSNMDGSNQKKIYSNDMWGCIYNIQVRGDRIFWVERSWSGAGTSYLKSMKLDGSGLKNIASGEDQFIVYDNKIVVRDANLDKVDSPVEIISYNLDGGGRKILFTPTKTKTLDLINSTSDLGRTKLLECTGGCCPFGIKDGRVYYNASGKSYSVNLEGGDTREEKSVNYVGTGRGGTNELIFGNMKIRTEMVRPYGSNKPQEDFYVNDKYAFSVTAKTDMNIVSPDYLFVVVPIDTATLISINPSIKSDIDISCQDASYNYSFQSKPRIMKVKATGIIDDGWYNLRCMYKYLTINKDGNAELNDATPYQKFKVTRQNGDYYTIQTESGKYLNIKDYDNMKNGSRVIVSDQPLDWKLYHERETSILSMRPVGNQNMVLNVCEEKNANGTPIIVWTHASKDAPNNSEFRFMPVK